MTFYSLLVSRSKTLITTPQLNLIVKINFLNEINNVLIVNTSNKYFTENTKIFSDTMQVQIFHYYKFKATMYCAYLTDLNGYLFSVLIVKKNSMKYSLCYPC